MGLLYGCFATILLYLEHDAPECTGTFRFGRETLFTQIKWTPCGIIAPEIIATIAITEQWQARRKMKKDTYSSKTHAFFALMEGYGVQVGKWRAILCSNLAVHNRTFWSSAFTGMGF